MRRKIPYLIICIMLCSCGGGGFSRDKAADIIGKYPRFSQQRTMDLLPPPSMSPTMRADKLVDALVRTGYLQFVGDSGSFTEKGNAAAKTWRLKKEMGGYMFAVPVAVREVVEVTGVSEEGKEATATFTWQWKASNDIGALMIQSVDSGIHAGQARFQKFDDGWRCVYLNGQDLPY